ncbi:ankyrin repeat domain-containing protein [Deinococcus sp. UYEF24]
MSNTPEEPQRPAMHEQQTPVNEPIDPELLAFFQGVFDVVRQGDAETLSGLLEKGLPVNLCNEKGDSLLMLATYHGHHAATRTLLGFGADPERRNDQGQTPILGAAFKGDTEMVRLLLDSGADIEGAGPSGRTTLMTAAMFNRTEIVDLLLERGADLRARDVNGMTVVDAARLTGATDTAQHLQTLLNAAQE